MKNEKKKIIRFLISFLYPIPVMFYLCFIGLIIGIEKPLGLILTFIGGFLGTIFLIMKLQNQKNLPNI